MKYNLLGNTGIRVSEMCFGTLPMGPLQAHLPVKEGMDLIVAAAQNGVTFFDTAQAYENYNYISDALDVCGRDVVITSKSFAESYADMEKAITEAMRSLKRDWIDIFLMHAPKIEPEALLRDRSGALECLLEYKQKGYLRAVGASTHRVDSVLRLADVPELDVIFPIYNKAGRGIIGGGAAEMRQAVEIAHGKGKALYSMKLLGGGALTASLEENIADGRSIQAFSSHAVGILRQDELMIDLALFNDEPIDRTKAAAIVREKQFFVVPYQCTKCGTCIRICPNNALQMGAQCPQVDTNKCLQCGYCAGACPHFAIRVK